MSDPDKRIKRPGQMVGWGLFLFAGLPWSLLMILGERACDLHDGPPCATGWGMTKLINFVGVILICTFAGWFTNLLANHKRSDDG